MIYDNNTRDLFEFFPWLKNWNGAIDFMVYYNLIEIDEVESLETYKMWKSKEDIEFFFNIPQEMQKFFIDKYNEMIDGINEKKLK
jgi:hypothetical protein